MSGRFTPGCYRRHAGRRWPTKTKFTKTQHDYKFALEEAREAIETVRILLRGKRGLRHVRQALESARQVIVSKGELLSYPQLGKCSFCDSHAATDPFSVSACGLHRAAFIDGKLGENACISVEEHQLVTDLRKLVDTKYHNKLYTEIFDKSNRPKSRLKGRSWGVSHRHRRIL